MLGVLVNRVRTDGVRWIYQYRNVWPAAGDKRETWNEAHHVTFAQDVTSNLEGLLLLLEVQISEEMIWA